MEKKPYTSTSIYRDDIVLLDDYIKKHGLLKRADGIKRLIKCAIKRGDF